MASSMNLQSLTLSLTYFSVNFDDKTLLQLARDFLMILILAFLRRGRRTYYFSFRYLTDGRISLVAPE
jgi:hypothetical protein